MRGAIRSTIAALVVGTVCMTVSAPSWSTTAIDAGGDLADARAHFNQGLALYGSAKYDEARAELESAYAIAPNYRLLYNLALSSDGQGDRAAAIGYLTQYLAEGGAEIEPERRTEVEAHLSRLRARVALVTIRTNVPGDAGVVVDDQPYGEVSEKPLVLLPGARKIWVTKAGYYPSTQTVLLKEGEGVDVTFDLKELPRVAVTRAPWWRSQRAIAGFAALGLTFAAITATLLRKKRARATGVVQLNPYEVDAEAPEPTPEQTNVIHIDGKTSTSKGERPLALVAAAETDIGLVKPSNQDSHHVDSDRGIFVVADGIGGFAGGEVASAIAVETIAGYFKAKPTVGRLTHLPVAAAELANATFAANAAIRRKAAADVNIADMGSTCVAARFCVDTHDLFLVHVGDSRVYRLRAGRLEQLTIDHTMAELGITGRRAQHLSRALGTEVSPRLDVILVRPKPSDLYLLCCDGLTKMVTDEGLTRILTSAGSPAAAVKDLVAAANAEGGLDNITALVVAVTGAS